MNKDSMISLDSLTFYCSLAVLFILPLRNIIVFDVLGGITFARIFGALFGVVWIISKLFKQNIRSPHRFHIIFLLYVLWVSISTFWAYNAAVASGVTIRYVLILCMMIALWDNYRNKYKVIYSLQSFMFGLYALLGGTLLNYILLDDFVRDVAFGLNPNFVGSSLVFGIPIAIYIIFSSKSESLLKKMNYIYLPLSIIGVLLSGSRAATVTLLLLILLIVLYMLLKLDTRYSQLTVVLTGFLSSVIGWVMLPPILKDRLYTIPELIRQRDLGNREEIWLSGIELFLNKPIIGSGAGNFNVILDYTAHSVYLQTVVELGTIGLIIFLGFLLIVMRSTIIARKNGYLFLLILVGYSSIIVANDMGHVMGLLILNLVVIGASTPFDQQKEINMLC